MVMDPTKNGVAGRITIIASVVGIIVVMLGGVYDISNTVSDVKASITDNATRLDRNCRTIVRLDAKVTAHILALEKRLTPEEREAIVALGEQSC